MAEMRSATAGSAKGASCASGSSAARGRMSASRAASSWAMARAFSVTHTPEAFTHDRPEFSTMDAAMTSRWAWKSRLASGPRTTLLYPGP